MSAKKKRYARRLDENRQFIPFANTPNNLQKNTLGLDEFEALRLVDYEGYNQIDASTQMQVSRATIQRLLLSARKKVVDSLLTNKGIDITNEISNIKLKGENNMDIESKEIIKIAFPSSDKVTIDGHFGKTKEFAVYTIKETDVIAVNHIVPPPHVPGSIPSFLSNEDVDVIITGGMGQRAIQMFEHFGIDVILGAVGRIDVNLNEYLGGFLSSQDSTCNHGQQHEHEHNHEGCGNHDHNGTHEHCGDHDHKDKQ